MKKSCLYFDKKLQILHSPLQRSYLNDHYSIESSWPPLREYRSGKSSE